MLAFRRPRSSAPPRLVETAAVRLREQVIRGDYGRDGDLPSQEELCQMLGVSRTVVREALQQLQSQRLVEVSQGRRPKVVPLDSAPLSDGLALILQRSKGTLFDVAEARLLLETEIAARAAKHATREDVQLLQTSIELLQKTSDRKLQVQADIDFHSRLASASGNVVFRYLLDALADLLHQSRVKTIGLSGVGPAIKGHQAILKAVAARDPEKAREAMRKHLEASVQDLKKASKPKGAKR